MRGFLLDTHVLLWWLADDPALGPGARQEISRADNLVFVSAATLWEISIKKSLGKLVAPDNINKIVEGEHFLGLPITLAHAERAGTLPGHHRDPFDRMLIVQAQMEGLVLITADMMFSAYEIEILSA
jgi:PIN domain nuclease of toxin-antitoxin system